MSVTPGSSLERIEIVEIGDARQARHGDDEAARAVRACFLERERIFGRQSPRVGEMRNGAEAGQPVRVAMKAHAVGKQRRIAVEIVDESALDQRGVGGVEDREGADERGDDAAAVDVADEDDRQVGGLRRSRNWRGRRRAD